MNTCITDSYVNTYMYMYVSNTCRTPVHVKLIPMLICTCTCIHVVGMLLMFNDGY